MDMNKACVYIALDELLGSGWGKKGREWCEDVITAHNGFPTDRLDTIAALAPVWVYRTLYHVSYHQHERMVRGKLPDGRRLSLRGHYPVIFIYSHTTGVHALCAPAQAINELRVEQYHGLIISKATPVIIDAWK